MDHENKSYFNIGVVFSDAKNCGLSHDFFSPLLDYFKKEIEKKNYYMSFLNMNRDFENSMTLLEQTKAHNVDGLFILNLSTISDEVQELFDSDMPVVTIDYKTPGAISISSDNFSGICDMVKYVYDMGHTKIAYLIGDKSSEVANKRYAAFIDTCTDLGIPQPEEYIKECWFRDMEHAGMVTEELLSLQDPPTCIFYPDDFAAVGGMNILRARGLELPRDISYCGFDGLNLIGYFEPKITTVKQNVEDMGKLAAQKLMYMIENNLSGDGSEIIVPTILEVGKSINKI